MKRSAPLLFAALWVAGCATAPVKPARRAPPFPTSPGISKNRTTTVAEKPAPPPPPPVLTLPAPLPADAEPSAAAVPQLLSSLPNLNDYTLLANGGWNANWYVGHNTCWVHKLPAASSGPYVRAFAGAKLGAMKTEPIPGRPTWERRVIPGEVAIALGPEPSWSQSKRYLLAMSDDIPLEGDPDNALEGVGESRWFWVEVPLKSISTAGDNYVALYSPDDEFRDARHAPILAAGPSNGVVDTWLNNSVRGQPPLTPVEALKTPVVSYEPAVALKLVPAREERPRVAWRRPPAKDAEINPRLVLEAEVSGSDIESAWVEFSTDSRSWRRIGRREYGAPYAFTLTREVLPKGPVQVRAVAQDTWENTGVSPVLVLKVPRK